MKRRKALRVLYARLASAGSLAARDDERLVDAFATVRREDFLGPGPWRILTRSGYVETPSDHVECLYQNVLVALDGERPINNGQPSLHATSLAALDVRPGDDVVHVGAGTGYYTAILAELVGLDGQVTALEIDPVFAASATRNLADRPNVLVRCLSGVEEPLPSADAVYVNAGATHPVRTWLDALHPGGRLLFPLTSERDAGGMLLVRRVTATRFAARFVSPAKFIPCEGARDAETGRRLAQAFERGGAGTVRSLHVDGEPDSTCWVAGTGWWLSSGAVEGDERHGESGA